MRVRVVVACVAMCVCHCCGVCVYVWGVSYGADVWRCIVSVSNCACAGMVVVPEPAAAVVGDASGIAVCCVVCGWWCVYVCDMLCVCMRACVLGWLGVGWLFVWWPVRIGCVWLLVLCVVNIVAHYVVAVDVVSVSSCVYGCCCCWWVFGCWLVIGWLLAGCWYLLVFVGRWLVACWLVAGWWLVGCWFDDDWMLI